MRYGSICSGIEAASVAWHPLGWRASFFSEVEPFPRAVLAQRWPDVPCHGDFTTIEAGAYDAIDLLVGGTPCQSFSIAGLRGGLDDERGNLSLEYCRLADRLRPRWVVWENVPGVLSIDDGRALASIVGALGQLGYGWAYRVLDAQYFGVPQRRRRVILVGYFGDWRPAAKVLFEPDSLRGDSPPRREAGQDVAGTLSARPSGGGGLGTDMGLGGGLVASTGNTAHCLNAGGMGRQDFESETLVAYPLRAKAQMAHDPTLDTYVTHSLRAEGFDASEDGTGRGTPLVPVHSIQERAVTENIEADPQGAGFQQDIAYTLEARNKVQAIAFDCKASGRNGFGVGKVAPTLRAMGHANSHQNAGGQIAIAVNLRGREGGGTAELSGDISTALRASQGGGDKPHVLVGAADIADTLSVGANQTTGFCGEAVSIHSAVRRLTPRECERLQGFPDDYTLIPWRKRPAEQCPDGPRYKALGNSMAVPVMAWVGTRIKAFEEGRL